MGTNRLSSIEVNEALVRTVTFWASSHVETLPRNLIAHIPSMISKEATGVGGICSLRNWVRSDNDWKCAGNDGHGDVKKAADVVFAWLH